MRPVVVVARTTPIRLIISGVAPGMVLFSHIGGASKWRPPDTGLNCNPGLTAERQNYTAKSLLGVLSANCNVSAKGTLMSCLEPHLRRSSAVRVENLQRNARLNRTTTSQPCNRHPQCPASAAAWRLLSGRVPAEAGCVIFVVWMV